MLAPPPKISEANLLFRTYQAMPATADIGVFEAFSSLLGKSVENTNGSERSERHCLNCNTSLPHLQGAKIQFELFLDSKKIPLEKITEDLCKNFQQYLLDKFNDKTPGNYFGRFKEVLAFAAHKGYFKEKISPAVMIEVKNNSSTALKKILSEGQYQKIIKSNRDNKEVQRAFIFSLYTSLRRCDVKKLRWKIRVGHIFLAEPGLQYKFKNSFLYSFVTLPVARKTIETVPDERMAAITGMNSITPGHFANALFFMGYTFTF